VRVLTSFGPAGYGEYGKRFMRTFLANSDADLWVYHEGQEPDLKDERIVYRNVMEVPGCREFTSSCLPAAKGRGLLWQGRNYRFDVHRFCRKSFAQCDAASDYDGLLYWIDADVEVTDRVVFPEFGSEFMQYMGRPEWHSCASFVGWDCGHPDSDNFWAAYYNIYTSGSVFVLPEWHDSYVLDWLRTNIGVSARDLAAGMHLKGPANVFDEVFNWGKHYKGNKKCIPEVH